MVFVLLDKVKSFDISKVLICQTKNIINAGEKLS